MVNVADLPKDYCLECGVEIPIPFPVTGEWNDGFCSEKCLSDYYEDEARP